MLTVPFLSLIIEVTTPEDYVSFTSRRNLETCFETAVEEFCTSNKLTPEMFAEIEQHKGVQIALEKKALQIFEDMLQ